MANNSFDDAFDKNENDDFQKNNYEKEFANSEDAVRHAKIHRRIEDILEQKRLKELLDDSEDWDI
ncbi:PA3496 family putative envelope integrity protein [Colwelliaceae bacterium 6471]